MNWIFKNKQKKAAGLLIALFFVLIFSFSLNVFLIPEVANAQDATTPLAGPVINTPASAVSMPDQDPLTGFFLNSIKWILYGVLQATGWLFGIVGTLFQWAVDPANISGGGGLLNKQAVKDVWVMVRDTLNMLFILILLFAAFCTVFQVENWSLKKVWLNILINALLVNFSYPIARMFIDISNVAMYYFLNHLFAGSGQGNGSAIMAGFGDVSNIAKILIPGDYAKYDVSYLIMAIIFTFILGITLLILAALFVVRLIALCLIIMFSPVGFVGFIFPATSKYASEWWDYLFKYAFFGPIMVFMMMVSLQIARAMGASDQSKFVAAASINTPGGQANWIANATFYLIPVIILWVAMGIAQSMGIAMSSEIVGQGKKMIKGMGHLMAKGAKTGAINASQWVDRKYLKTWSPRAFKAAWDANKKTKESDHIAKATGAWRDRINYGMSRGKDKTHFEDAAFQSTVLTKAKELGDVNQESDFLMAEYKNAMQKHDKKTMSAVLRLMFSNNDQNEFMKEQGLDVDPSLMRETIFAQLKGAGMTDHEAAKQLSDLSEIAISKGNFANYGMAYMEDGEFKKNEDKRPIENKKTGEVKDLGQVASTIAKQSNIKAQGKADSWHWNSFLVEKANGDTGELHSAGKAQLRKVTRNEIGVLARTRSDFIERLGDEKSLAKMEAEAVEIQKTDKDQAAIVREFAAKIKELKNAPKDDAKQKEDKTKKELEELRRQIDELKKGNKQRTSDQDYSDLV